MEEDYERWDSPIPEDKLRPLDLTTPEFLDWREAARILESSDPRMTWRRKMNKFIAYMNRNAGVLVTSTPTFIYYKSEPSSSSPHITTLNAQSIAGFRSANNTYHAYVITDDTWKEVHSDEYACALSNEVKRLFKRKNRDEEEEEEKEKEKEDDIESDDNDDDFEPPNENNKRKPIKKPDTTASKKKPRFSIPTIIPDAGQKVCLSIVDLWINNPYRRRIERTVFGPPELTKSKELNLFHGFAISQQRAERIWNAVTPETRENVLRNILGHLARIWCGGFKGNLTRDQWWGKYRNNLSQAGERFHWLISFFAHMLQKPWIKIGIALIVVGLENVGKSLIPKYLCQIIGETHAKTTSQMDDVFGNFPGALCNGANFIHVDEAHLTKFAANIKNAITENKMRTTKKGQDATYQDNYVNFIWTANPPPKGKSIYPPERRLRRFCLFTCAKDLLPPDYFKELGSYLNDKDQVGLSIFAHFLYNYDISNWDRKILISAPMQIAQIAYMESTVQWLLNILSRGLIERLVLKDTRDRTISDIRKNYECIRFDQWYDEQLQNIARDGTMEDPMKGYWCTIHKLVNGEEEEKFVIYDIVRDSGKEWQPLLSVESAYDAYTYYCQFNGFQHRETLEEWKVTISNFLPETIWTSYKIRKVLPPTQQGWSSRFVDPDYQGSEHFEETAYINWGYLEWCRAQIVGVLGWDEPASWWLGQVGEKQVRDAELILRKCLKYRPPMEKYTMES